MEKIETRAHDPIAQLTPQELALLAEPGSPLQRVLDALPFIIRVRNHQGRVLFGNKAAGHFDSTTHNLNRLLEMTDWGGNPPDGKANSWIQPWLTPDRTILHYSCKRIPITSSGGEPLGCIEYALDVSHEEDAKIARKTIEKRFDILIEQSVAGVYIIQNHRFFYCNKKLSDFHGYTQKEICDLPSIGELIADHDRKRIEDLLANQLQEEIPHIQYSFHGKRKDGSVITLETMGGIIRLKGQPAILGTVLDITSQVKMEKQLQFTQKMEVAGQLSSTIAHDFNNLLTIVKGATGMLAIDVEHSKNSLLHLAQIQEAADKSIHLTQQLLQLGKQRLQAKKALLLNESLDRWIQALSKSLPQTLQFTTCKPPLYISADESAIERSLFSLIKHAANLLPSSGRIDIHLCSSFLNAESQLVQMGKAALGDYAAIKISYNSPTPRKESVENLFDPCNAPKKEGIPNFSPSIAYNLIRKHDGWIDVTNRLDGGIDLTIFLPLAYHDKGGDFEGGDGALSEKLPQRSSSTPESKPNNILVVEDEEIIRSILEVFLSRLGYTVLQAPNADEGIDLWHHNQEKIGLILSDIVMPGSMNGSEMVRQCALEKPTVKAVLMSGYAPSPDLPKGPNFSFIEKPFSMDQIADVVHKMMP